MAAQESAQGPRGRDEGQGPCTQLAGWMRNWKHSGWNLLLELGQHASWLGRILERSRKRPAAAGRSLRSTPSPVLAAAACPDSKIAAHLLPCLARWRSWL